MTPNTYRLIERCIEEGVQVGINRAYKHAVGHPSPEQLFEQIQCAVMHEVSEWFLFDDVIDVDFH